MNARLLINLEAGGPNLANTYLSLVDLIIQNLLSFSK